MKETSMIERLICECGHEWETPVRGDAETTEVSLSCPICAGQARRAPSAVAMIDPNAPTMAPWPAGDDTAQTLNGTDHPALPGVAGYDIVRELGRGGMGVVYLARHKKLDRLVALKMVLAGRHIGETERSRFQAEAAAVARLQHPNIVQLFEIGESEGRPFFCLEYVDGGSLADQLDGTPAPGREAAEFLAAVARAVHAAHREDLVHRDLKPGNILLRNHAAAPLDNGQAPARIALSAFQAKITDFGLAKRLEDANSQTQSGTILGTPSYMAPEQAGGHSRQIGPATDVYALGAILYELLTGCPPFRGETPLDTVLQVVSDEPVKPSVLQPKCPRDLETICLKCLEKDTRKRYAGAQLLADDLQRFLNNEPILARPIGPVGRTVRWTRRHPGVAALLALIAILLTSSFIIVVALWRRAEADRADAIDGRKQAAKQEERARANLAKAIEAVDRMLTRVADEKLAYVPQFEDERRKILEEAVAFYNSFLKEDETDPSLRREMGRAYFRLGKVFMGLGKHQQARESFQQAQKFQESLTSELPQEPLHRGDLALTLSYLGDSWRVIGNVDAADPLYARAFEMAEALVRDFPADAVYRQILAEIVQRRGLHYFQTRRIEEAEQSFERCLVELRVLLDRNPSDYKLRLQHADALTLLGYFQQNLRRNDDAEKNLKAAVAEFDSLIRDFPDQKRECEPKLANARLHLGFVLTGTNRSSEADEFLKKGMSTYQQLVRDYPKSPTYRFVLARGQQAVGIRGRLREKPEEAERALKSAIDTLEQLDREHPEAFYQGMTLRQCYRELGQLYMQQKNFDQAIESYQKAVSNAEAAMPSLPKNSLVQFEVNQNRIALAQSLNVQRKYDDAIDQIDRAIAHCRSLDRKMSGFDMQLLNLRMHKAAALAGKGDHAAALAEAEQAVGTSREIPTAQYNLACVYALCSKAVRDDARLPTDARSVRGDDYEKKAIEILKRLRSNGYFRNPGTIRTLMQDTDLDSLRKRADFRQLLDELPMKPKRPPGG